jgi:hypothetical protein
MRSKYDVRNRLGYGPSQPCDRSRLARFRDPGPSPIRSVNIVVAGDVRMQREIPKNRRGKVLGDQFLLSVIAIGRPGRILCAVRLPRVILVRAGYMQAGTNKRSF